MIALLAPVAAAQSPVSVEQAAALGMPRLHHVFSECDCLGMTWTTDAEDLTLEVPRDQISAVSVRLGDDEMYELWVTAAGESELLVERGPCVPLEDLASRYSSQLRVPLAMDGLEAPMCGHVEARLRADLQAYDEEMNKRFEKVQQLDAVATLTLTDRRGRSSEAASGIQRSWRALRPVLAHCMRKAEEPEPVSLRLVVRSDGSTSGVKLSSTGTGADIVDDCLVRTFEGATADPAPGRKEKLLVAVDMP